MTAEVNRARASYVSLIEGRINDTRDEAEQQVLKACLERAAAYDRSDSMLGTLARLVEACDAIATGEAAALAANLGMYTDRLRPGRTPLNSRTVDAYVRLRARADEIEKRPTEWTGPRDATVRRQDDLREYLNTRRDSLLSKPRPSAGSRGRRVEEIVGSLNSPEDRQDLRFTLERGFKAQRELDLLRKAIESTFPAVDLNELLSGKPECKPRQAVKPRVNADTRALAQLRTKLQSEDHLRHFTLSFDGRRIKLAQPPGTQLIEKSEWEALSALLASVLDS